MALVAPPATPSGTARDRVLDAYEELLAEQSERAATLDAVAARAGVSKGGLLYHFASKEALTTGVLERFAALIDEDVSRMRAAENGPVDYFLRTSIPTDSRFERAIVAIARLAQAADPRARDALAGAQRRWLEVLQEAVGDPLIARTIMLIGDGMYYNTALLPATNSVLRDETDIDDLVALIRRFAEGS
ncbi:MULTISPECIES: TetR/AcrR family transcriptional regulator [unclassified Leifsonia]|uniref:TetR/AcrR family transcriptional regulator n=1 Tax=unclassified Leifsonia TaxID=2663824 RepID=UPI0008A76A5A|nr:MULTISPECIES: TetR/AcrR family transcriptional regulator [unclassified Leifsonia]SEI16053.1 DNA-binding transcriptional regulator, AcrR family [Leifsonia sp. CL154]SFM06340.1 DNA-binding transcriptional regulator, AcrR family [Leifsonia sp. CL147]